MDQTLPLCIGLKIKLNITVNVTVNMSNLNSGTFSKILQKLRLSHSYNRGKNI